MDWGVGHYEHVAAQLRPAAEAVVAACRPQPGEHVVDLGCGTGNAALLAARAGSRVDARAVLEPRGEWQRLCDETIAIFVAANEDPARFRVSSEYTIVTAVR
jgi:hypothetical protein